MVVRSTRTVWTIPIGLLVIALAAWAAFVPLVGPYFGFGFETDDAWSFTRLHWILSLAPGIVAFAGGLMMFVPLRAPAWLGGLLALLGGVWLVVGPSLYPLFSSGEVAPLPASEWKTALLWIGYFYGVGALIVFLAGLAQGIASRRPAEVIRVEEPVVEPGVLESSRSRTLVYP
jgi:hypothetical protein